MAIVVSMWSRKAGEIKDFLQKFFEREVGMDNESGPWIHVCNKPLDAIDIISAVIDNNDKYSITLCIQVDQGDVHPVTVENHNDIIKGLLYLFYTDDCIEGVTY